jgi:hypothetical protein
MQSFKLSEIEKVAGTIDIVEYISGDTLIVDNSVFCISKVEDVESDLAKTGKQWKLTIHFVSEDDNGQVENETCYLSLGHNKQRDKQIEELQQELDKSKDGRVHSFKMFVHPMKRVNRKVYHFHPMRDDDGTLLCECSHTRS